jgi:N-acetylglutamate synthase-like GNAT family acetyltransferase
MPDAKYWHIQAFSARLESCKLGFVPSSTRLHVRRATAEDIHNLKALWKSMHLPYNELKKRLTEFQVVQTADGKLLGAIGMQIVRQHALLHSEAYFDFALADHARQMFLERIRVITSHHGVFRLWTQETSPFWTRLGFRPATAEKSIRLPEEWDQAKGEWFTLQLKDEEVITNALEKNFTASRSAKKQETARVRERARTLNTIVTVVGFSIGILCFGVAVYLLIRHNPFSQTP